MRWTLLLLILGFSTLAKAEDVWIDDRRGNEITVQTLPADGDLLVIWFVDHDEPRAPFDEMLHALNRLDVEVWRVDLLAAYFLPRSSESVRTLPGDGIADVIGAAHRLRDKSILLASYDRMPLPLLRGAQQWQLNATESRLLGAMLFYPNLFGPPPLAGDQPQTDPILSATNIPLVIYQPELGSQRWRLPQVIAPLWEAGAAAYVYLVPEVRDWYFMGEGGHGPAEQRATDSVPGQILHFARQLAGHSKPVAALPLQPHALEQGDIRTLVEVNPPKTATPFALPGIDGSRLDSGDLEGRVTLLNFWATWCPPCVEELPSLNRLRDRYAQHDLQVVSIDFRETPDEMKAFLQRTPVTFPVLMDRDGQVALNWGVFSFPSTFIIDRQGRIRYTSNRAIDWDSEEVWKVADRLLEER